MDPTIRESGSLCVHITMFGKRDPIYTYLWVLFLQDSKRHNSQKINLDGRSRYLSVSYLRLRLVRDGAALKGGFLELGSNFVNEFCKRYIGWRLLGRGAHMSSLNSKLFSLVYYIVQLPTASSASLHFQKEKKKDNSPNFDYPLLLFRPSDQGNLCLIQETVLLFIFPKKLDFKIFFLYSFLSLARQ